MKYYKRIIDDEIKFRLETFGAVLLTGPKWVGKTTTAEQFANSIIRLQDPDKSRSYIETAKVQPSFLLEGDLPRLIDEWQIIPELWDAVRLKIDNEKKKGMYILTGSNSTSLNDNMHTGIGRISRLNMYPMSLSESGDSNKKISLSKILNDENYDINGIKSDLSIEELIFTTCRGGLPEAVTASSDKSKLFIPKDYINSVCLVDINTIDDVKRNVNLSKLILKTYARNVSTIVKKSTMINEIRNEFSTLSNPTYDSYLNAFEKLFVVEEIDAWNTNIRSKTAVIATKKRVFTDPSFATAILNISPKDLQQDLKTFGFLFENLCIRDLKIYSSMSDGEIKYYRDRYGLEADIVLTLNDGKYALIECKLGSEGIESGAKNLLKLQDIINNNKIKKPDALIILTGGEYAYVRDDGVKVIPIGCLTV